MPGLIDNRVYNTSTFYGPVRIPLKIPLILFSQDFGDVKTIFKKLISSFPFQNLYPHLPKSDSLLQKQFNLQSKFFHILHSLLYYSHCSVKKGLSFLDIKGNVLKLQIMFMPRVMSHLAVAQYCVEYSNGLILTHHFRYWMIY